VKVGAVGRNLAKTERKEGKYFYFFALEENRNDFVIFVIVICNFVIK
jgi:hypothetical protein